VTAEPLVGLGAERLAKILAGVADTRVDLKRRLRMELAAHIGAASEQAELWAGWLSRRFPKAAHTLLRRALVAAFRRRDFKTSDRLSQEADAIDA